MGRTADSGRRDPIKAILFDLDGTLHDRTASLRLWLHEHLNLFDLPDSYAARFLQLDDFGYRPKREVIPQLCRELNLPHDPAVLLAHFSDCAFACPEPMPHALEVLLQLRQGGVKIGIVTNGWAELQMQVMNALQLTDLVDDVVISKVVGFSKPDSGIYDLALQRLGVSAIGNWFVGDSPRNDIWGPQQVGLKTAFLPSGHALQDEVPHVMLSDLRGVLSLVN